MIDARQHHDPGKGALLIANVFRARGYSQKELAARLDVSPRYLQQLVKGKPSMSYPVQCLLEAAAQDGDHAIDARLHHDPGKAASLVAQASGVAGGHKALAGRLGTTVRYLQMLESGQRTNMSYALQAILEGVILEARQRS